MTDKATLPGDDQENEPEPEPETEPENEPEENEPAEETTPETDQESQSEEPQKPSDELKVVITMKGNNFMVGVQSPDCDPVYETGEGDLKAAVKLVSPLVNKAREKWSEHPKYPDTVRPEPPPQPEPVSHTAPARTKTTTEQPKFF